MIRLCVASDHTTICEIINAAAHAYEGVIPPHCWHEPYMPLEELRSEVDAGVSFVGYQVEGDLAGVMGSQDVSDVTLIRHAYVRPEHQGRGIGHALLTHLLAATPRAVLVGTWSAASWAISFYERHGFTATSAAVTKELLHRYWTVPGPQAEASTVLVGPGGLPHRCFTP